MTGETVNTFGTEAKWSSLLPLTERTGQAVEKDPHCSARQVRHRAAGACRVIVPTNRSGLHPIELTFVHF